MISPLKGAHEGARDRLMTGHLISRDGAIRPHWDDPRVAPWVRRKFWATAGGPRFIYKYRTLTGLADEQGLRRLKSIVLDHRLWLAAPSAFPDIWDSHVHHKITKSGSELRSALERYFRRAGKMTSAQARKRPMKHSLSDLVANPHFLEGMFKGVLERLRNLIGVCSMALTVRSSALWDDYSDGHRGICFQFAPWLDPSALMGISVTYSDEPPTVVNWFDDETDRNQVINLILRKSTSYSRELEYRIFDVKRTNCALCFRPEALTAVMLGARVDAESRNLVIELLKQRFERTGHSPKLYQAVPDPVRKRLRFKRLHWSEGT